MFQGQTLIAHQRPAQDSIVLARLANGEHVQIGAPATREGAHALHTVLDTDLTGWGRDRRGRLVMGPNRRPHTILGTAVSFYRVREGSHEFGAIAQVPVNRVARGPVVS